MLVNLIFRICLVLHWKLWGQFVLSLINAWRFCCFFFYLLFICLQVKYGQKMLHIFPRFITCTILFIFTLLWRKRQMACVFIAGSRLSITQTNQFKGDWTKSQKTWFLCWPPPPDFMDGLRRSRVFSSQWSKCNWTSQNRCDTHVHFIIFGSYVLWFQATENHSIKLTSNKRFFRHHRIKA